MAHGSETRRMRGGKTGVKGRRSREDAGLGNVIREKYSKPHPGEAQAKLALKFWKNLGSKVKHEWFGTKPASATSLVNKGNTELRIEKVMSRLNTDQPRILQKIAQEDIAETKEAGRTPGTSRKAKDQSSPPNYPPSQPLLTLPRTPYHDKSSSWSAQIPLFSLPSEKADWIRRERESIERQRRD